MKIIKKGKLPSTKEVKKTCNKCSTKFTYTQKDINYDMRDGNYVICPLCKTFISAE